MDNNGHGTNVSDIISRGLFGNYCLIIVKFFENGMSSAESVRAATSSMQYVASLPDISFLNYSGGGYQPIPEERAAVDSLLNRKVKIVAAAGNNGVDISRDRYYPASYDSRIIVVGNLKQNGERNSQSNYRAEGMVWEVGTNVQGGGYVLTGTSQATAVHTNRLLKSAIQK
jgi:hypothetical protein